MSTQFERRKSQILQQLSIPDSDYADLSPKGSVDDGIRDLVSKINQQDGYVTTSSCAGRIAVFLEGSGKTPATAISESVERVARASQGGKGGGSWLYVSHEPIDIAAVQQAGALFTLLGLQNSLPSVPTQGSPSRFVHFKFEPMILHILTSSLRHAQRAHSAAMSAGFRESGISGVTAVAGPHQPDDESAARTPLVAVRTSGLNLESIIAFQAADGTIQPMVSEAYLRVLVHVANERFKTNAERKQRFAYSLFKPEKKDDLWEPAAVRRARKREEGLRRQQNGARKGKHEESGGTLDQSDNELSSLHLVLGKPD